MLSGSGTPRRWHWNPSRLVRMGGSMLILTAAYYAAGQLGLLLATPNVGSPSIWLPTGISIGVLALSGPRLWPAVWAGSFAVYLPIAGDLSSTLGIASGNTAEALVGAHLLRRLGGVRAFENPKSFLAFLGSGAAASTIGAVLGVLSLGLVGTAPSAYLGAIGLVWWLSHLMGTWALVPLILLGSDAWSRRAQLRPPSRARVVEAVAAASCLLAVHLILFGGVLPGPWRNLPAAFASMPPILWVACRFGRLATVGALVGVMVLSAWGTARGSGPFATHGHAFPLLQAFMGSGFFYLLLAVAVRARTEAERRLRESERRLGTLIGSLPGIVWESTGDPAGPSYRIDFVSDQAERMLGYPPREWLTRHDLWIAIVHPDDRDRVRREAAESFAAGQEEDAAFRCVSRDGKVVDVEMRAAVIRDALGKAAGMRGFMMNLSDRRRAEEKLRHTEEQLRQAQKMEAMGRLAGGVAHDFNNLLTAVNGYSELLLARMGEQHPMREYAAEILAAGERGAALTRQLLVFSRKEVVQARIVDVNAVVDDILRLLGRLVGESISLRTSLEPDLLMVRADPDQLGQILLNLAINGRDAMHQRGGSLDIETANVHALGEDLVFYLNPKPGPCVRLTVRDSGAGMAAELMEHLFEPFITTKEPQRGTWLGLSTVYSILERMGGGIRVESAPGRGSAFHIYIPAAPAEAGSGYVDRPLEEVPQGSVAGSGTTDGLAPAGSLSRAR